MKYCTINERWAWSTSCFDSFLEHRASSAAEGIRHNRGGNQMIWVKDHHVVDVINDTSAIPKVTYDMDVSIGSRWCFKPPVTKMDTFDILGVLDLNK